MIKKLTTIIFCLMGTFLLSQSIINQDRLGTGQFFQPSTGNFLSDGSTLYTSSTDDSLTIGDKTVTGFGDYDGWVVKMSYNHQIDWQKCFGGFSEDRINGCVELPNGNLLLIGNSSSSPSGNKTSPHFGGSDIWLILLDNQGNKIWDKSYGGSEYERVADVEFLDNHLYILAQSESGTSGNKTTLNYGLSDLWLLKIDLTGQIIWQKSYGGNDQEYASDLIQLNNKFYISSSSSSSPSGNKTSVNYQSIDGWLIKLDATGNIENQFTIGGNQSDYAGKIKPINNKLVMIYGSYSGVSGSKTTANFGSIDGQIAILDTNFNIENQWAFGGTGYDYLVDFNFHQNELIIVGGSNSEISGNKTVEPNNNGSTQTYNQDIWFISFDTLTEQFIYQESIGGNNNDDLSSVLLDDPNNIRIVSISWSENTGDKTIPLTSHNGQSMYFEFWTFDYTYTLDLEEENTNHALSIYPNPFTNKINLPKAFANQEIAFYTTQGRLVLNTKSNGQGVVETSQLNDGFYILKLIDDSGKLYKTRVVKQ